MAEQRVEAPLTVHEAFRRLHRVVEQQGWTILSEEPERSIRARTRGNLLSWGEEITAKVEPTPAGTIVVAESHPIAQLVDYGRSTKNVGTLIAALQHE